MCLPTIAMSWFILAFLIYLVVYCQDKSYLSLSLVLKFFDFLRPLSVVTYDVKLNMV